MRDTHDYQRDLTEIRAMMERSTKFLSLSGLAGVMAGIYALVGVLLAVRTIGFDPTGVAAAVEPGPVVLLASVILILAIGTAALLSWRKARIKGERIWNAASRRVLGRMAIPLVAGGLLILLLLVEGLAGLAAPLSMVFYGIALYGISEYTYRELGYLGLLQIALGLVAVWLIEYSLWLWAIGFGLLHIIYGIYIHLRHER